MGKKVSALLFRINKFNLYKNIWVFNYKQNYTMFLKQYYKINNLFKFKFLNLKILYHNYIYNICGKVIKNNLGYNLMSIFTMIYNYKNLNKLPLFLLVYKLKLTTMSTSLLKIFIKFNLLKYNSIQNLYNKLHKYLLTTHMLDNKEFIGLKIIISGRLSNTKLANSETFQLGSLPLQHLEMLIMCEKFYILTKYGLVGIKIWLGKNK